LAGRALAKGVRVSFWHLPAAPADSQWVRLLRYWGPSVVPHVNVTWLGGTTNNRDERGGQP
jgi:hypothetical protein